MITSETKSSMFENNGFLDSAVEQFEEGEIERVKLVVHEVSLCPQIELIF